MVRQHTHVDCNPRPVDPLVWVLATSSLETAVQTAGWTEWMMVFQDSEDAPV